MLEYSNHQLTWPLPAKASENCPTDLYNTKTTKKKKLHELSSKDKTGMLCFHKQRHTVSIQRRLLGFVKASRTSYPSSIKVYKSVSASLPFSEFSRFQCLSVNYFALKKLRFASVILHCFVYIVLH